MARNPAKASARASRSTDRPKVGDRKMVRSFTAYRREIDMLAAIAAYHGFSRSGTITNLIKKEFWRIFPRGNETIRPDAGARVTEEKDED